MSQTPVENQPSDRSGHKEPIAIIGIGCRFPGGVNSPDSFWQLLSNGIDAITEIPSDRIDVERYFDPRPATPGKIMTRWGGFLEQIDQFDASFFGISPRETDRLDPQQRLLLEVAWEALEDAGQTLERLSGSQAGVFIGLWLNDYESRLFANPAATDFYMTTGSGRYSASGRISYSFGFQGPSITIDTACSSSLVAVHLACQSLWRGESPLALAGGANVILQPHISIAYSQSKMMAPDGHCKFGDARADGYVRSEGAGLVVLKLLSQALADGDPVYAVIRGSAVNNDGRGSGTLATPAQSGQEELLRLAYRNAGISPGQVQYVEAHGTGTRAGDPVEIGALGAVLATGRVSDSSCFVGSVKTNFGHTEGAAGIAGLIKVALALKHRAIPASLHLQEPNPAIPWSEIPLVIPRQLTPWPVTEQPAAAGVSAFGIAGTNAHAVLQEFRQPAGAAANPPADGRAYLIPLSARSSEALRALARTTAAALADQPGDLLPDLAFSLAVRRSHHDHRLALVAGNMQEVIDGWQGYAADQAAPGLLAGVKEGEEQPKIVFVFPGQGAQWLGMGRELLAREPIFRQALERCEQAMRPFVDWSLSEQLGLDESAPGYRLDEIDVIQPVLLSLEIALAELWRSWGVEPAAVIGHSMGEVGAAYIAGALSLDEAMQVICRRSQLMRRTSGQGAMAVVELSVEEAQAALAGFEERLSVAVSNSPRSTVISGDPAALAEMMQRLEERQVFCRLIKVDVASHSPQMDPLKAELRAGLVNLQPQAPAVPIYSTALGQVIDGPDFGPDYWVQNLRQPVLFSHMVQQLLANDHTVFIEMSPHPILLPAIQQGLQHAGRTGLALASLRREQPEQASMLAALGQLYTAGYAVAWERLYPAGGRSLKLPSYPWQRERFWYEPPTARLSQARPDRHPLLQNYVAAATGLHVWESEISLEEFPYLADHRVQGTVVLPAAAFVEMALAAADELFGPGAHLLENFKFTEALVLADEQAAPVQVVLAPDMPGTFTCQIFSRPAGEAEAAWKQHASTIIRPNTGQAAPQAGPEAVALPGEAAPGAAHYEAMAGRGLDYGPAFQGVSQLWRQAEAVRAELVPAPGGNYLLHPTRLDAGFQLALATLAGAAPAACLLPVGLERLRFYSRSNAGLAGSAYAVRRTGAGGLAGDVILLNEAGEVIAEAEGLHFQPLADTGPAVPDDWFYEIEWQSLPAPAGAGHQPGAWLILADQGGLGRQLAGRLAAWGATPVLALAGPDDRQLGANEYQLNPARPESFRPVLAAAGRPYQGIIHLWSLDGETPEDELGCLSLLYLVQALNQVDSSPAPRLWLVTQGVQRIAGEAGPVALFQAPLWGLGRVVAAEQPELRCTCLDLSPAGQPPEIEALLAELLADTPEEQVALRAGERYGARLVQAGPAVTPEPAKLIEAQPGQGYRLEISTPGILDNLALHPASRRTPGPGQVEIEVCAAGLNFIDVMKAMGIYPGLDLQAPVTLGAECAGRIIAVGEGVTEFQVGDAVLAVTPSFEQTSLFSAYVTVPAGLVLPKPAKLTFEEAATIPLAFLTAYYAMYHLGRLDQGERVLIHSATGGVGLAAVQLARLAGADIFATAGTPEKRTYLHELGIEHVMDSRSLAFAGEVMAQTGGQGVDMVLNSLAGEAIPRSLDVLRPYGRFLEIGKRDIYQNQRLGLEPFKKSLAFFAIDLARLVAERPGLVMSLWREIMTHFESGDLAPLPAQIYPINEVAEAFRSMARGQHIGKIVLSFQNQAVKLSPTAIRPDGAYLVTGGMGGLGLAVARWLVEQGGRRLVLLGRRGPSAAAQAVIGELEASGAQVTLAQADVAVAEQVAAVLAEIKQAGLPLRGIVHAAGLLDDGSLASLERGQFERVMAPKVAGAWNLHHLTQAEPLDFFILFSSVAALLGTAGQGNYAAANAFLDALAHYRQAEGLPALSINWGPWSQVGLAAARSDRGERLAGRGLASLTPEQGIAALARLAQQAQPQVGVMPFDLARWTEFYPPAGRSGLFAQLKAAGGETEMAAPAASVRQALLDAEPGRQRQALLEHYVCEQVAQVLRLAADRVPLARPLKNLGLDSLMTLELRNRLEAGLGVTLSATLIWNYPTVAALVPFLAGQMGIPLETAAPAEAAAAAEEPKESETLAELEELSAGEVSALLAEELAAIDDLLK